MEDGQNEADFRAKTGRLSPIAASAGFVSSASFRPSLQDCGKGHGDIMYTNGEGSAGSDTAPGTVSPTDGEFSLAKGKECHSTGICL